METETFSGDDLEMRVEHHEYERLKEEYDRLASRYDARWSTYVERSVRETLRHLDVRPGDRVLDVGCGTGVLLERLIRQEPEVQIAGVDLSGGMLEVARDRLGLNADLRQDIAEALPFEDAAFDVVVSSSVFHFIQHPEGALNEMRRVLKPSGRVAITCWCRDYLTARAVGILVRVFNRVNTRSYGSKEFADLLEQAGFSKPMVERYKISWMWGMLTAIASKHNGP